MITKLSLTNFRNHNMCRIETGGCQNIIITGPNGAGKTAILEAVSMLGGDRGMRGASMGEIARFAGDGGFCVFSNLVLPSLVLCIKSFYGTLYQNAIAMINFMLYYLCSKS